MVYLNLTEPNCRLTGIKSHAFFEWASGVLGVAYLFVAKGDDDAVVNLYQVRGQGRRCGPPMQIPLSNETMILVPQMRLLLTTLPRRVNAFVGRALPFFFEGMAEQAGFPFPIKVCAANPLSVAVLSEVSCFFLSRCWG